MLAAACEPSESQKAAWQREQVVRDSMDNIQYKKNIENGKSQIISLFVDPVRYSDYTRPCIQYSRWSDEFQTNLVTIYTKDNKDFMVKTNNPQYPLLYADSTQRNKMSIGQILELSDKNWFFQWEKFWLEEEDNNNEEKKDPRGINFWKSVVL